MQASIKIIGVEKSPSEEADFTEVTMGFMKDINGTLFISDESNDSFYILPQGIAELVADFILSKRETIYINTDLDIKV